MRDKRQSIYAGIHGGFWARYLAFLDQRHPRKIVAAQQKLVRINQGLINVTIFLVLLIAILTVFGFGLSRFSRLYQVSNDRIKSSGLSSENSDAGLTPPPTVYPSGHADIKSKSSPDSATGAKKKVDRR